MLFKNKNHWENCIYFGCYKMNISCFGAIDNVALFVIKFRTATSHLSITKDLQIALKDHAIGCEI